MARTPGTVDRIAALDPIADDHEIVVLSGFYDFPWDNRRALELALFRTYAVPSIGRLQEPDQLFLTWLYCPAN